MYHSLMVNNISSFNKNSIAFRSNAKSKILPKFLLGLSALGAIPAIQSCEKEIGLEAFNDCPYQETVFTNMPKVSEKVDYVFRTLGLLPSDKSIYEVDSVCFSDKNNNRIQLSAPRDSAEYLKMDMKKISPRGEISNDELSISNYGYRKIRIQAPLMPAHNNSELFQSEFWDSSDDRMNTFTEIRYEPGSSGYNHYLVEKSKNGFRSRAAMGRGDDSKSEWYNKVNVYLK